VVAGGTGAHKAGAKIMIIAGEASGDLHGANLVKEMLGIDPTVQFYGVGGPKMAEAGVYLVADTAAMAVVGITEVFCKLRTIYRVYTALTRLLSSDPPDVVILIDYPDFNLRFARAAHKRKIPIIYYISPQVWAWRQGRVKQIARLIDEMIVIFPFEKKFYQEAKVAVTFVGHPLLDSVRPERSRDEALRHFGLRAGVTTIGLLPGSRRSEVRRLLPTMLKAVPRIADRIHPVQFIIPVAPGLDREEIERVVGPERTLVRIVEDSIYDVMQCADLLLVASGTATVEGAIMGVPMVVVYRISPVSYFLARVLIKVKNIAMVNIIAEKTIAPELVQDACNPETIADQVVVLLQDPVALANIKQDLMRVREKLGDPGATRRAAEVVVEFLQKR
jgi:lipid-A-disaccharide synthase